MGLPHSRQQTMESYPQLEGKNHKKTGLFSPEFLCSSSKVFGDVR